MKKTTNIIKKALSLSAAAFINRVSTAVITGWALCLSLSSPCQSALVGLWTFENDSLADSTGNFGNLVLYGDAVVSNGALDLNGIGTTATGWARTPGTFSAGGGGGVALGSKTLVSWITLQSLSVSAGSAMTLDGVTGDQFDGIVFGEQSAGRWMNGSNGWSRSQGGQFDQIEAVESSLGSLLQLAITYQDLGGGNVQITGYRNGNLIGSYTSGNFASWGANEQEVIFGQRFYYIDINHGAGALDALIHEARLYDSALSQSDIQSLTMIPEPNAAALLIIGFAGLAAIRVYNKKRV